MTFYIYRFILALTITLLIQAPAILLAQDIYLCDGVYQTRRCATNQRAKTTLKALPKISHKELYPLPNEYPPTDILDRQPDVSKPEAMARLAPQPLRNSMMLPGRAPSSYGALREELDTLEREFSSIVENQGVSEMDRRINRLLIHTNHLCIVNQAVSKSANISESERKGNCDDLVDGIQKVEVRLQSKRTENK